MLRIKGSVCSIAPQTRSQTRTCAKEVSKTKNQCNSPADRSPCHATSNERIHSIIKRLSSLEDSLADVTSFAAPSKSIPCGKGISSANEASNLISGSSASAHSTSVQKETGHPLCSDQASLHQTTRPHYTQNTFPSGNDLSQLAMKGLDSSSLYPPCLEARSLFLDQLRDNGPSSTGRRIVLESALSFVERMPNRESIASGNDVQDSDTRVSVSSLFEEPPITIELLYTMLNGNKKNFSGKCVSINAHIC